ncbi:hypothetical protein [Spiroplasma endosymbiont of Notiophilus biguttatus]|uniref:hypothetical protein n=1 Tax=Spiroplasma endosymbiont of Notiophilus biguttatus TaxID=3066285 RepID=UPI00313C0820
MPLSETVEYRELNDFLQKSLSSKKDESLPDITLNSLEVKIDDIKTQLDSSLKEYIIELVYIDEKGRLVNNTNDENVSIIQQPPLPINSAQLQQLVIIKEKLDSSLVHLYRTKKENDKIILEYLGEKELPLLLKTQSESNNLNNEEYKQELDDLNVNIIKRSEVPMKLSFAENGTCYLFIDDKNKTIVPVDVNDAKEFKNFVAKECPRNGTINIEVDKNGKILFAYIIDNQTHKRQDIEIDEKLIDTLERVISTASFLHSQHSQNNSVAPKKEVQGNNSFPAKEVNGNEPPSKPVEQTTKLTMPMA